MANKFLANIELDAGLVDGSNSTGTSGYVLSSTGSGVAWVDASTVIGGPYLPLVGGTMTGTNGVLFPDNFILKIGNGSDLQIYHDGSNSYIKEAGIGRLILSGGSDIQLQSPTGEFMADFNSNGSVDLYYDNSKKFETTSTGVTVTGIVEATGGNSTEWNTAYDNSITAATVTGTTTKTLTLTRQDGGTVAASWSDETGSGITGSGTTNYIPKFTGTTSLGNSLVYDNGTNVGIGTTSPDSKLEVEDGSIRTTTLNSFSNLISGRAGVPSAEGYNLGGLLFQAYRTGTTYATGAAIYAYADVAAWTSNSVPSYLSFHTAKSGETTATERMVIDSNGYVGIGGNVGIGTTNPSTKLTLEGAKNTSIITLRSTTNDASWADGDRIGGIDFYSNDTSAAGVGVKGSINYETYSGTGGTTRMTFKVAGISAGQNNLEAMRIDAGGNVGINTTAPTEKLAVTGNIETTETANGVKIGFNVGDSFTLNGANTAHYGLSCGSSTSIPLVLSGYYGVAIATNGIERVRILHSNGNVGINKTNPTEKLEVVGNIKANNYINQRVAWNSTFSHTTGANVYIYIPVAYVTEQTADTYFSNWIAAYGGRVRKIVLRGAGTGNTQTATTTIFRVMVNGSTVFTTSAQTVVGTSPNKVASYEFGDSDAVFSAKDRVQVLFNANGLWYNAAVGIIIEYTE
jgi:hypothetical protein